MCYKEFYFFKKKKKIKKSKVFLKRKNETSFSRLRIQGPQTPGKLHEPSILYMPKQERRQTTYTSVIPMSG